MSIFAKLRSVLGLGLLIWAAITAAGTISEAAETHFVQSNEVRTRDLWVKDNLPGAKSKVPFSFNYDGHPSSALLNQWAKVVKKEKIDKTRTKHVLSWVDTKTGLEVRCEAIVYSDYPVVEWVVYFKNICTVTTPMIENIQGLDTVFERGESDSEFVLHGIKGDFCTADSYEPYRIELGPNTDKKCNPPDYSGKSCDGPDGWPFYNLQKTGGGVILAVGWPGQWASEFKRDGGRILRITAGQQLTHLVLNPGEEIRTPLIAMLFWQGQDVVRSQNMWRRWYLAHVIPQVNGRPQPPIYQIQVEGSEANIENVKQILDAGINPDVCWRDAGWYSTKDGPYKEGDAWLNTGTWKPDPERYPKGFKPFSEWVHSHGMKFLLWFEPERIGNPESWLGKNHPEWLLPKLDSTVGAIFNEGNPDALNWLINHVDGMIKSQGIDWYREDMNGGGPLPAWRKADTDKRQGITENFYVQGHLRYWDELRKRNPGLGIDSCASGGRRNDLETMRRAVPFLRSDFQFPNMKNVVEGNQCHTYGLSSWLPYQGTGCYFYDKYSVRSYYLPCFGMGPIETGKQETVKLPYEENKLIAPIMLLGDYYPLTSYSLAADQWIGWQFNRSETDEGFVQMFRRSENGTSTMTFPLKGLNPKAKYAVINFDQQEPVQFSGKELMETGLVVTITDKPGSAVFLYRKVK